MRRFVLLFSSFLPAAFAASPQNPPAHSQTPPSVIIRGSVQEVLLDLVVRDKHEKMIRDLKATDLEVYEDGQKQDVRSFRVVTGAEARVEEAATPKPAGAAKLNPMRELNLVLIVFRMMGANERLIAKQAAEDFLKTELRPNTYVGVFSLDYRLNALQQFTNRVDLLQAAVRTAASGAYRDFSKMSDAVLTAAELQVSGGQGGITVSGGQVDTTTVAASVAGADVSTSTASNVMRAILAESRRTFSGIAGMQELEALKVMVQQLGLLPGRKTVLMMSTGLQLPPQQLEVFRNLYGTANRYNVSIYALDVNGLTTYSPTQANSAVLRSAAAISATQSQTPGVSVAQATQDDLVNYGRVANVQAALDELARNTGGFLIANNDWRKALRRIMEDVNTHYELSYSPKSSLYDGHFRKVEVKLLRPGMHVQSRNGYFAVPDLNGRPVEPFELGALRALDTKPAPRDFEYRVGAMRFRPSTSGWQYALTFEIPTRNLGSAGVEGVPRVRIHPSFFAIIKDENGQIVDKLSRDMPYEVPSDRFEAFHDGNIIVTQPFSLPPGRYHVESAVVDRESLKASTRRLSLAVPPVSAVAVSSVALVRRLDPISGDADPADPFQFSTSKVTPTLSDSIAKGGEPAVYFVVYSAKGTAEKPQVVIQYFRDGKEIGRQAPKLADTNTDANGGIPLVVSAKLEPGQYEVRVTALQAGKSAQQSAVFTIDN